MDVKLGSASVAGIPAYGAVVNLAGADVAHILAATSGLLKTLAIVGGGSIGVALAIMAVLANLENRPTPKIPLNATLSSITTLRRRFCGIALNDDIQFECEGNSITAPLSLVNRIWSDKFGKWNTRLAVELVDGSVYQLIDRFPSREMRFLTIAGIQTTALNITDDLTIQSATVPQLQALRDNLNQALKANAKSVIDFVGADVFEKYFNLRQFA